MSAPTKRRHASYYLTLLLVTVVVFSVVMRLAAWQRAEIIAELADCVAHRDAGAATVALRQLAAMPRPPLEVLVAAAMSSDRVVAGEAQYLIDDLLRRWQRQLELQRHVATVARQLTELADALVREQAAGANLDPRWVRNTADDILRLANQIPARQSPLVAAQCDTLLATATTAEMATTTFIDRQVAGSTPPVTPVVRVADVDRNGSKVGGVSDADEGRLADEGPRAGDRSATESLPTSTGLESTTESPPTLAETGSATEPLPPIEATQPRRPLKWTHPMLGIVPAMPIRVAPLFDEDKPRTAPGTAPAKLVPESADDHPAERRLARTPSRELLARWLEADGREVFSLEDELTRRGFGRLSARLVEPLFSDDAEERLRLVDDVLTEPGVDARPWLMLLAEDAEADVRLLAVTIMATSADRTLLEKAWEVAIRDRDPRIAGLADRLRERRDGVPPR